MYASVSSEVKLKLKLKTNLYSAIKSEDSEALDGGTSRLSNQREYGEIKMFDEKWYLLVKKVIETTYCTVFVWLIDYIN